MNVGIPKYLLAKLLDCLNTAASQKKAITRQYKNFTSMDFKKKSFVNCIEIRVSKPQYFEGQL
jgi:DNA gyrase/topoisomerase IV subunit B